MIGRKNRDVNSLAPHPHVAVEHWEGYPEGARDPNPTLGFPTQGLIAKKKSPHSILL